jgi:hypothetical protein
VTALWLVPLGIGAAGAVALSVVARRLAHQIDDVQRTMQILRADRAGAEAVRRSR